jgi:hypothetical protein
MTNSRRDGRPAAEHNENPGCGDRRLEVANANAENSPQRPCVCQREVRMAAKTTFESVVTICGFFRLDDEDGIMVSGGVDENNRPLASVEFFSIPKQVFEILMHKYIR